MELGAVGLSEQPFPTHGKPPAIIAYASKIAAIESLNNVKTHLNGAALLQGPSLSGKSTLIRSFVETLPEDFAVAVIDGKGLNTTNLLASVLRQFGYDIGQSSANELLGLVRMFVLQQATSNAAPMLIIENTHELNPSALRALCELAELKVRHTSSAMKLVLVSDRSLQSIISTTAMTPIAKRIVHDLHLRPMNAEETRHYLYSKLQAAGSDDPEFIFPAEVCREIWRASGGWPGIADRVALLALAQTNALPVAVTNIEHPALPAGTWADFSASDIKPENIVPPAPPRLVLSNNGSVMSDLTLEKTQALIGRSVHNDISIPNRFVSRHHVLLVRDGTSTLLMDLNSTNGTFVNSNRVSNHVLIHDDVITLGDHRIKFYDPCATAHVQPDGEDFADTAIMKTLEDMRNLLARENAELLPTASENLPTI